MHIQELSEYYQNELQKRIPAFEVFIQIDNKVIVIECIEDRGEILHYLNFDCWKGKGSIHNYDSGISVIDIEKILMPLLVEFGYVGKMALKNKYHNTIKSDIEKNNYNPSILSASVVSSEDEADEQISIMINYINEVASPFFEKMGNLQASFNEIITLDNNELTRRLNPVGAIQRKMIIQYQLGKEIYKVAYDKYLSEYMAYYKDGMDEEAKRYLNLTKKLNKILIE